MLGIVVSLPWELKTLTRQKIPVGTCRPSAENFLLALSGMGADRAYAAASLLTSQGATALLSWGSAAALDHRVGAGDLILPERIIAADGEVYRADPLWHGQVRQALSSRFSLHTGPLVESNAVVRTAAEKRALATRTGAIATDMESAAQARSAREHGLPLVAIRAIADTASTDVPWSVLKALDEGGHFPAARVLARALLRPQDWTAIMRLGLQFGAAYRTLKRAAAPVLASVAT